MTGDHNPGVASAQSFHHMSVIMKYQTLETILVVPTNDKKVVRDPVRYEDGPSVSPLKFRFLLSDLRLEAGQLRPLLPQLRLQGTESGPEPDHKRGVEIVPASS